MILYIVIVLVMVVSIIIGLILWQRSKRPIHVRRCRILNFDSFKPVKPRQKKTMSIKAPCTFRPDRLVLSSSCANKFFIDGLLIRKESQFTKRVHGSAFAPDTYHQGRRFSLAKEGDIISLTVINNSDSWLHFNAALFGDTE